MTEDKTERASDDGASTMQSFRRHCPESHTVDGRGQAGDAGVQATMTLLTGFPPSSSHSLTEEVGLPRLTGGKHRAEGTSRRRREGQREREGDGHQICRSQPWGWWCAERRPREAGEGREAGGRAHRPHGHRH